VNSTKYSGCMRCFTGVCAALSPSTMPPFHTTKAAKIRGTRITAQRSASRTYFRCHALSMANRSCCGSASGIGLSDLALRQRFNTDICRLTLQGCKLEAQVMPRHTATGLRVPHHLLVGNIQNNAWLLTMHSSSWADQRDACMTLTLHDLADDSLCLWAYDISSGAGVHTTLQLCQADASLHHVWQHVHGRILHCARQICIFSCRVSCAAVGYC